MEHTRSGPSTGAGATGEHPDAIDACTGRQLLRARPLEVPIIATGLLEAVAVRDGRFTPVLRCVDPPRTITLEFTEQKQKQALNNLCRWVAVKGRLRSEGADGYRLEVHRLRAARRIDEGDRER